MRVGIIGVTGNVGKVLLEILEERKFPISKLYGLASFRSKGNKFLYLGEDQKVLDLDQFDFSLLDIAFFSAGRNVSKEYVPKAVSKGVKVIDNTSMFRYEDQIPLVVAEINSGKLATIPNIVANPNCSTIQMVLALFPLKNKYGLSRVIVSTYQSTSGAGYGATRELLEQTSSYIETQERKDSKVFTKSMVFNTIPHIDHFMETGETKEEWKMKVETQKILDSPMDVHANCARVPTLVGHGMYVNVELKKEYNMEELMRCFEEQDGVELLGFAKGEDYMDIIGSEGKNAVYVSRVRRDESRPFSLSFWCVSDNLRKGAALNSVQIGEILLENMKK